jgi:hypothetical protein
VDEHRTSDKEKTEPGMQHRTSSSNKTMPAQAAHKEDGRTGGREQPEQADQPLLQEKDHPFNEKTNERWMNFWPEDTRKEIEELEHRASTLRAMLSRLGGGGAAADDDDDDDDDDETTAMQTSSSPSPSHETGSPGHKPLSEMDMIVCSNRIREEDEDSLDRELIGTDSE